MSREQLQSNMPKGSGRLFIQQITNADGELLSPPPRFEASITMMDFENVRAQDPLHGKYQFAVGLATGLGTPKLKATLFNHDVEQMAKMFYGEEVVSGADLVATTELAIPPYYTRNYKIQNVITFHMGKWASTASVVIGGSAATLVDVLPSQLTAGKYTVSNGKHFFAKADAGKTLVVTWDCLGDATIVSTLTVPKAVGANKYTTWNANSMGAVSKIKKAATTWTKDAYAPTGSAPASAHYKVSPSGVIVLNSGATGTIVITHKTDKQLVSSSIDTLPAAGYRVIVDPPGTTTFVSTVGVSLVTNSGTAMTGVAEGEDLTESATPTSGQYDDVGDGIYDFAAADVADIVSISCTTDFEFLTITPPDDGEFIKLLSIKNGLNKEMNIVEFANPIVLASNEYCIDEGSGTVYFDRANAGETWSVSYLYHTDSGRTMVVQNKPMGEGVELEITVVYTGERKTDVLSQIRAFANQDNLKGKADGHASKDIEFTLIAGEDGVVWKHSSSVNAV